MLIITAETVISDYLSRMQAHTRQIGGAHAQFMALRQRGIAQLAAQIGQQIRALQPGQPELFSSADLREFATGDVTRCLGPAYAVYQGRRCPRIPNGDLLLISRILSITGEPGRFDQPSHVTAEYDVPVDAWYLEGGSSELPISICLEVALQPCGFLSAYLGTPLRFPDVDFFFRNLDGQSKLIQPIDARGKTIQVRAVLLKTVFSGTTIIQHFSFELSCEGIVFFTGGSSFGYFPSKTMGQVGLDGGKPVTAWFAQHPERKFTQVLPTVENGPRPDQLKLIDDVLVDPTGGEPGAGYVYASRENAPSDWFYACHFYQDPVMPGSLGIETIVQAMKVFLNANAQSHPQISMAAGQEMAWKYRGQVMQKNRQMRVEVHFRQSVTENGKRIVRGDASLWADEVRIYEVRNISLSVQEARA